MKKSGSWQPERPFVPLPISLLRSAAWRSLGINAHRLIEFLMIEHLHHAGKQNGSLLAPRRQLIAAGIRTHSISSSIKEAEQAGLIDVGRGRGRAANRYTLTWLPMADGTEPTNRWRGCEPPAANVVPLRRKVRAGCVDA